jgi:hypothetical protein
MNDELKHTPIDGLSEYISALDTICASAKNSLNIFEKNYEGLGFNGEARCESLRRFLLANPYNRLNLMVYDPKPLLSSCPRLLLLLRQFGHNMSINQPPKMLQKSTEPFTVADGVHYVRRFHFDAMRGLQAVNDPVEAGLLNSKFKDMWSSARPCASGTTLGL